MDTKKMRDLRSTIVELVYEKRKCKKPRNKKVQDIAHIFGKKCVFKCKISATRDPSNKLDNDSFWLKKRKRYKNG